MSTASNPDGQKTLERLQKIETRLDELQKVERKLYNNPLFVGIVCIFLSLGGAFFLDNLNEDKPPKAEIKITGYDIVTVNRQQNLYDIGVNLHVENLVSSQHSFTIDQTSIFINVPDELRPELINISDYYKSREWMNSFSYSNGMPVTVKPGDYVEISSNEVKHTFTLIVPGEYTVRVLVYKDSFPKILYGDFNIHLSEHGTIYTENIEFPIKLEPFEGFEIHNLLSRQHQSV